MAPNYINILQKIVGKETSEGVGAKVIRTIGGSKISYHDPFLLLDEFHVNKPAGFPDHPHRGFETITYMLDGAFEHCDNHGGGGIINTGDIQWMTAGSGLIHSEMPVNSTNNSGLQLWVNLKAKDKMIQPKYQGLIAKEIPILKLNDEKVIVKIIGGKSSNSNELVSPIQLRTKVIYLDIKIQNNENYVYRENLPKGYQGFIYFIKGNGLVNGSLNAEEKSAVLFSETLNENENLIEVESKTNDLLHFVIIAGEPMKEPMARYGPFVMNTQEEIRQAFVDYQTGKFD
ncbi:hypothetical protein ABK040_006250 [Willaertia magna]